MSPFRCVLTPRADGGCRSSRTASTRIERLPGTPPYKKARLIPATSCTEYKTQEIFWDKFKRFGSPRDKTARGSRIALRLNGRCYPCTLAGRARSAPVAPRASPSGARMGIASYSSGNHSYRGRRIVQHVPRPIAFEALAGTVTTAAFGFFGFFHGTPSS